jgi:hypothetical protein
MARVLTVLKTIANWIYGLRAAAGSLNGYLNLVELARVVASAAMNGGGIYAILTSVIASASTIFAAPYVAVAVAVLTAAVQAYRLLGHGDEAKALPPAK